VVFLRLSYSKDVPIHGNSQVRSIQLHTFVLSATSITTDQELFSPPIPPQSLTQACLLRILHLRVTMDPFSTLPAEIILTILEFCLDFASLDGFLRTSARADQVGEYYKTITERVMKNCPITSYGLQAEFRNVVQLELDGSSFTVPSVLRLLASTDKPSTVPLSLPAQPSLGSVREAVRIAVHYLLRCFCLHASSFESP
jgi:hypothetical protein